MSEHQRETAFLRRIIRFDDAGEHLKLEERIAHIERDQRRVRRVALAIALFIALGAATLVYGMLLQDNFLYGNSDFLVKLVCEIGLAALISLMVLMAFLMIYRQKLNGLREEYRQLVVSLMESQLEKSRITPGSLLAAVDPVVPRVAVETVPISPIQIPLSNG